MKTRIVSIGKSQGVRIPKRPLEQTGLCGEIEIRAVGKALVVGPARKARSRWDAEFRKMARRGDDRLLDDVVSLSKWDEDEWEWE